MQKSIELVVKLAITSLMQLNINSCFIEVLSVFFLKNTSVFLVYCLKVLLKAGNNV